MSSKYAVGTVLEIETGEIALSGSVNGPLLSVGQKGKCVTPIGDFEVVVVGIGVSDRTLGAPERQGILVKVLKGVARSLNGATIEFEDL